MKEINKITISKKRYAELLRAQYKLECLEDYGIDKWCDYYDAMNYRDGIYPSARDFCDMNDDEIISYEIPGLCSNI